ncbi:MAG: hypothetical protein ACRDPK_08085, partial [Carbonactinosporaceae bacterium]
RRKALGAAAAVVAALVLGVGGLWLRGEPDDTVRTVSAHDGATGVSASLDYRAVPWGTSLTLQLSGIPSDARCRLLAVGAGEREVAASWHATYRGGVTVPGAVALPVSDIDRFEVVTFGGEQLVAVPAH